MLDFKDFEALSKKLYDVLPQNVQNLNQDLQKQFQDVLKTAFQKMDLVTRDEFDVQVKVLLRTREKVETLEKELKHLKTKKPSDKKNG